MLYIASSVSFTNLSSVAATALFDLCALVNGLTLVPIFIISTVSRFVKTFFISAVTFIAMSIYGFFTTKDLSKMGSILFMALIGLIICVVVNMIWPSDTFGWIISVAGVLIFVGLTAWDTQQIKNMALMAPGDSVGRLATIGALTLYLDFINLFLYLLSFFGSSRD